MRVSIFGIGYVGAVTAACLAKDGHTVIAVDPNLSKVNTINSGRSPIIEPDLEPMIAEQVSNGRLRATQDPKEAILNTDVSFVCVGTPSRFNGSLDTGYVSSAAEEIGAVLKEKNDHHTVIIRSTVLPGTTEEIVIPAITRLSGKTSGVGFTIGYNPEFLREGTAIKDQYDPGAVVIGAESADSRAVSALRELNKHAKVEPRVTGIRTAEAVKYANNCWHALKISFANEIGNICKAVAIDGHDVMDIVCADQRLNISPAYLKPGFAFGGSCLPKDLRAIRFKARQMDVPTPVLDAALTANEVQLRRAFEMVTQIGVNRVGLIGLSFKADTDDLRESPLVELAERLHGKGYNLRIYDPNVSFGTLNGANLHYIKSHIPHLSSLLAEDVETVCAHAEVVVLGNRHAAAQKAMTLAGGKTPIVDLVRLREASKNDGLYQGICW